MLVGQQVYRLPSNYSCCAGYSNHCPFVCQASLCQLCSGSLFTEFTPWSCFWLPCENKSFLLQQIHFCTSIAPWSVTIWGKQTWVSLFLSFMKGQNCSVLCENLLKTAHTYSKVWSNYDMAPLYSWQYGRHEALYIFMLQQNISRVSRINYFSPLFGATL